MDVLALAAAHTAARRRTAAAAVLGAVREWRRMDRRDLATSWTLAGPRITAITAAGQHAAAATASDYTSAAVSAQGQRPDPAGAIDPAGFAGTASDGRPLATLLQLPLITAFQSRAAGGTIAESLDRGERLLRMLVDTEVADAGRAADGAAITADHAVTGYIRVVSGGACGRCAILAGREYEAMEAFQRHPHCHCQHVPNTHAGHLAEHVTDPHEYFEHLTAAQQNRAFTLAGAQAIRDGADINQVVNARRGITTVGSWTRDGVTHRGRTDLTDVFGRRIQTTTEGVTKRSLAHHRLKAAAGTAQVVRLTPESIYQLASDRDDAVRLLHRYGYIL